MNKKVGMAIAVVAVLAIGGVAVSVIIASGDDNNSSGDESIPAPESNSPSEMTKAEPQFGDATEYTITYKSNALTSTYAVSEYTGIRGERRPIEFGGAKLPKDVYEDSLATPIRVKHCMAGASPKEIKFTLTSPPDLVGQYSQEWSLYYLNSNGAYEEVDSEVIVFSETGELCHTYNLVFVWAGYPDDEKNIHTTLGIDLSARVIYDNGDIPTLGRITFVLRDRKFVYDNHFEFNDGSTYTVEK